MKTISIGANVKSFPTVAIEECSKLESITVNEGNINYSSQDGILYNKAKTELVFAPKAIKSEVTIPDSVTEIGEEAFFYCRSLTDIQFQGTVQEWKAIQKGSDWDYRTGNYTVTCTDGTVDQDGKVTYFGN